MIRALVDLLTVVPGVSFGADPDRSDASAVWSGVPFNSGCLVTAV